MSRGLAWILALAPQFAVVAGIVVREEIARASGTEVRLEVRAVDPMDLLSGRYVSVPLAIARLDLARVPHPDPSPATGSVVYVRLRRGDPNWEAAEVVADRPDASGGTFVRGELERTWGPEMGPHIWIDFAADRFYIPEDAADPSRWGWNENRRYALSVVARIDGSGRLHVVDLHVDGRPFAEWNAEQLGR